MTKADYVRSQSRLNAPEGYRWTDDDVRFEKKESWYDGLMVGWTAGVVIGALIVALMAW